MEVIVDTNILVYETVEDSIYHKDVMEKLEKIDVPYLLITNILIEFILVMKKLGLEENFIVNKVLEILEDKRIRLFSIKSVDFKEALKIIGQEKMNTGKINDKIVLALARKNKLPIYTYDKQLKRQAKNLGIGTI
ncbi:PIN domain-containing protein [Candidatus Bathyarchaeota archaeon]|nr:MAG: PIN domain-containing protein [Candidatus Bathyarchaeota archaeon]